MPLPTAPVKLGNLLPAEEYKAKARPARSSKRQANEVELPESGDVAVAEFSSVAADSRPAANTANTLRAIASETLANAAKGAPVSAAEPASASASAASVSASPPASRSRRGKQTAALLQPSAPAEQVETAQPVVARQTESRQEAPVPAASAASQPRGQQKRRQRGQPENEIGKLFVLDTNVLMHDPSSLFRFEEHDVYLPMMTLEELDNHKKGMSEVARNAPPGQPHARRTRRARGRNVGGLAAVGPR